MIIMAVMMVVLWLLMAPHVEAGCVVESTATYADGTNLRDDKCDTGGGKKTSLVSLIHGEDETNDLLRVSGGAVRSVTIMTGVTTNTTSAVTTIFSGGKTPLAEVNGTGAVSVTVRLYGAIDNNAADGQLLCTISLSGTTKAVKGCDGSKQFAQDFPYYYATTSSISGTGATVEFIVATGHVGVENSQTYSTSSVVTSDTALVSGPAVLHCILVSPNDAAPTAGTIIIYDNTAESGTVLFNWTLTTAVFVPFQVCLDRPVTNGIYAGFTTTADVNVSVSYR